MMAMAELSTELREYLKRCGQPEREIEQYSSSTRMFHDLDIYGDIAEAFMEELRDHYHVDFCGFEFEKFFPYEYLYTNFFERIFFAFVPFAEDIVRARQRGMHFSLTVERILFTLLPFAEKIVTTKGDIKYLPLPLEMIDKAIHTKRWPRQQQPGVTH